MTYSVCGADYSQGFGGKFGVQSDRMDKTAHTFTEQPTPVGSSYKPTKPDLDGNNIAMNSIISKVCLLYMINNV